VQGRSEAQVHSDVRSSRAAACAGHVTWLNQTSNPSKNRFSVPNHSNSQVRHGLRGVASPADGQFHHRPAASAGAVRQRLQHRLELVSLHDGQRKPPHRAHARAIALACESLDTQSA
jgi:hypothetical protein